MQPPREYMGQSWAGKGRGMWASQGSSQRPKRDFRVKDRENKAFWENFHVFELCWADRAKSSYP